MRIGDKNPIIPEILNLKALPPSDANSTPSPNPPPPPEPEIDFYDPTHEERVNFVIESWGKGYRTNTVVSLFKQKFKLSQAQAYRYVKQATAEIAESVQESRDKLILQSVNRMDTVFRRAMTEKNYKAAIESARHRDTVLGLVPRIGIGIMGGGQPGIQGSTPGAQVIITLPSNGREVREDPA